MAVAQLTDKNFQEKVLNHQGIVLIDFWAPWCGPCQIIGPTIEELASELGSKIKIGKLNVDENPQTANKLNIMSIPTLLLFKNGKVAEQMVGIQSKEAIWEKIEKLLGK